MRCPDCKRTLHRGEARCTSCGWVKPGREKVAEHPFHRLPKCSRCSSGGLVFGPLQQVEQADRFKARGRVVPSAWERSTIGACNCPRGEFMADAQGLNIIPAEHDDDRHPGYHQIAKGALREESAVKPMPEAGGKKQLRFGIGTVDLEI